MIPTWLQEQYERERHEDYVRQAQTDRALVAADSQPTRATWHVRVRAALGVKLIEWGTRLEASTDPMEPFINRPFRDRATPI